MHGRNNISVGKNGNLSLGKVDLAKLAEKYGTPLYVMDEDLHARQMCAVFKRLQIKV
ncbi:MAG: hypothetical protein MZU97_27315 [Bacillus subtilis]|nr:hypothetical protein [Bacillus subtilis]